MAPGGDVTDGPGARAGRAEGLSRGGSRGGQDLPDARRGAAPCRAWGGCGGGRSRSATAGPYTEAMLDGWRSSPGRPRRTRGADSSPEMDLAAVLARRPQVGDRRRVRAQQRPGRAEPQAVAGHRGAARRRDRCHHALNIQHLESLSDVVEKITGVPQHETVPDEVVRRADQIELVDMPPEGLRRRMAHGNIYPPEKVDAALRQLLPAGKPHRAAGAGAAVGGGPGRRGPAASTGPSTASAGCGRPGNGWWWRSPAARRARP